MHDSLFILYPSVGQAGGDTHGVMSGGSCIGAFLGGAAILFGSLAFTFTAPGQQAPMPLLTDTAQYCSELSNEVEAERQALISPAPPEVEQLAEEGRHLCAIGQVRGGVARLRRAMVLLRKLSGRS